MPYHKPLFPPLLEDRFNSLKYYSSHFTGNGKNKISLLNQMQKWSRGESNA